MTEGVPDDRLTPADDVRWPPAEEWHFEGRLRPAPGSRDEGTATTPPGGPAHPPDEDPHRVPWSWTDGLALIAWFLIASTIVGTIAVILGVDIFADQTAFLAIAAVSQVFTFLGALVWLRIRDALSWRLVGTVATRMRHVGIGVVAGVAGWIGMTVVLIAVVTALGIEELPTQESIEILATGDTATIIVGVLLAVILAPIVEEFIYRSVLFQGLRQSTGLWPAIIISAVIFGVVHLETILQNGEFVATGFIPMSGIVLVGAFWAWIFHRTGNLVVPVVGHAVFNGIAVGLALLTMRDGESPLGLLTWPVRAFLGW
jgi:membrane protease YdiL (CAAX protease family)